jgi:hypothetical protein
MERANPAAARPVAHMPRPMPRRETDHGTNLATWPKSATLRPWIIPDGSSSTNPWPESATHISQLIDSEETVILLGFGNPGDWVGVKMQLVEAAKLGIPALIMHASNNPVPLGQIMFGAGEHANLHKRQDNQGERAVFSPSVELMRILGIDRSEQIRNCTILIHKGHVRAYWVASDPQGMRPHAWSNIYRTLHMIDEEEPAETLELD